MDLFDLFDADERLNKLSVPHDDWRPDPLPDRIEDKEIFLNFETTGLQWWEEDEPLAVAMYFHGRPWYFPTGHRGQGNLPKEQVVRFLQREVRDKKITNINTRFEVHMGRQWGVDFEAQGNRVSDVGHYVALLDDHRMEMNLDSIINDYLGEPPMARLDESRMRDHTAGQAAPRAMYNVDTVRRLKEKLWPELMAQNLKHIINLEEEVIYATVEMEKNGSIIDLELLDQYVRHSQNQLNSLLMKIAREVGFQVNPDSTKDQKRVFEKLKIPIVETAKGHASFTDDILKRIDHPIVKDMRRAGKLMTLRSKFIVNTKNSLDSKGIFRYALHQLRAAKDEFSDPGEAGTVTGRYSSAAPVKGVGGNIQQRMKAAKQRKAFGLDEEDATHDDEIFLVRKLHIAGAGAQFLSSDMDQAQYRIFASYVNNPKIIQAYKDNPKLKFHDYMYEQISPYADDDFTYRRQKDLNFAVIFGAGLTKMSLMMGHISQQEFEQIRYEKQWNHPKLQKTKEVRNIYNREIPEVQPLLDQYMHIAKPACDDRCKRDDVHHRRGTPHQGFVTTIKGRRMRFPDGNRLHKAFNGVDQGTEADYMKTKLVELHKARLATGFVLRITNHDEIAGDAPDLVCAHMVDEILNRQSFPELRVPMTWSTEIGPNWAEGTALEDVER